MDMQGEWSSCQGGTSSTASNAKDLCLDNVQEHILTTHRITISIFEAVNFHGKTDILGHCMWVPVLVELVWGTQLPTLIVPANCHVCRIAPRFLQSANLSEAPKSPPTMIPAMVIIGNVATANQVPLVIPLIKTSRRVCLLPLEGLNP